MAADERNGDMIYRKLGSTGERVSAIGLGGYHIGVLPNQGKNPQSSSAAPSTAASRSWTTAGTIWTASAKSGWVKACATATGKRYFSCRRSTAALRQAR